jgi:fumarate reductase flavoprotein subunit
MKRRWIAGILAVVMVLSCAACQGKETSEEPTTTVDATTEAMTEAATSEGEEASGMKAGTYTTTCNGFYGDFELQVTVSEDAITDITYGEHSETVGVGAKAIDIMINRILEANSTGVDTVSGATVTSSAVKRAVIQCLNEAGAPAELTATVEEEQSEHVLDADIVVVGGGGAGLAAAIAAKEEGANVILLEKQDILGGSTLISAGIVYAALDDSDVSAMVDYYMDRAEGKADREMLTFFAEHSQETVEFLESLGTMIMFTSPAGTATEARARFTMLEDGTSFIGYTLVHPMEEKAEELGIEIYTGVEATSLIQDESGAIVGVKGTGRDGSYTVNAGAVILATGGYDASTEMKAEYAPSSTDDYPLSNKGNVGDGIRMGMEVGADTIFNGGVIGFTCLNATLPSSGYSGLAMAGAAWASADGTYLAPNIDYPITHTLIKSTEENFVYGLLDAAGADSGEAAVALGYGFKGDTIAELAAAAGADEDKLTDAFAQAGLETGAPYYLIKVSATTIGSMGGLKVNTNSEVLDTNGDAIPGLYAAGETANGAFYYQEYPASGSSNCIGITFGLQAGRCAASYITSK